MKKTKYIVCLIWILLLGFLISSHISFAQKKSNEKPLLELVNKFDTEIHKRFLMKPGVGMWRIAPINPIAHIEGTDRSLEEGKLLESFNDQGWQMGLYLIGRKITEKSDGKKFAIAYHINKPLPLTNLSASKMPAGKGFMREIKVAFDKFKTDESYEFERGKWSYFVRPVRAMSESCLQCHKDYVIEEKLAGKIYKFRTRKASDAIGVLVYAFSKK